MRKLPTHLKLLRGNPGKRAIQPEPEPAVPATPPEPPDFLSQDAKNEWFRVVPEPQRLGLFTMLDIAPFAAYCGAYARWVSAERLLTAMADKDATTKALLLKGAAGNAVANPLLKIARCAAADMVHFAGEFGMTPLARSRLGAPVPPEPGKFGHLLTRSGRRQRRREPGRAPAKFPKWSFGGTSSMPSQLPAACLSSLGTGGSRMSPPSGLTFFRYTGELSLRRSRAETFRKLRRSAARLASSCSASCSPAWREFPAAQDRRPRSLALTRSHSR